MSYTYTGYHLRQTDYLPWQPVHQPPHHPIRALAQQPSYPHDGQLHPQHHPYQARQPNCWDPPWLRQTTAYQQLSSYEPDLYSPPPPSCWDLPWLHTQQGYSPYDQPLPRPPSCWDPPAHPTVRQPTSWDLPSLSIEFQHLDQPPSFQLSSWVPPQTRQPPCWEPPVNWAPQGYSSYDQPTQRQPLGFQQYDQPPDHRPSCWEPPLTATVAANQPHQNYQQPPLLSRADRQPQQPSPAHPDAAFGPPPYAASDTYAPSSYVLLKTSSWDVLESSQKENLIVDCDRVEEGFDDSTEKILDSSARFCGVEKVDIDKSLEAEEDDFEERKTVEEEKSNVIMKDKSGHVCVDEDEVSPQHLECFLDYDAHTLVPIELVDSMADKHLGKGNDRIEGNCENKDRD